MIAGAMGIAVQGEDPLAVILGHIRDRPFLLILDNCEHVIEAVAGIVERIVEEAPRARVLATSREPLRVRAEHAPPGSSETPELNLNLIKRWPG